MESQVLLVLQENLGGVVLQALLVHEVNQV